MSPRSLLLPWLLMLSLLPLLMAPIAAQAQSNSRQAIEAARKHRAERGDTPRQAAPAATRSGTPTNRPYRSSADPNADPNLSLKSCLDHVGMNPVARDRCMRQHCEGRWGQGQCPASGGNVLAGPGATSNTPLGRCLREAGRNPFKRDACGWRHCFGQWDSSAECAAIKPRDQPLAN